MRILLSKRQYNILIESEDKEEFVEIDIAKDIGRLDTKTMPHIEDVDSDTEFNIQQHFNANTRDRIIHNIGKKTRRILGNKVIWRDKLNLDDYNDIAYVKVNNPEQIYIDLYTDDNQIAMSLKMRRLLDGYQITWSTVTKMAEGKRLAARCYVRLSEVIDLPIYSDSSQTEDSRYGIWYKLYEMHKKRLRVLVNKKEYKIKMVGNEMTYGNDKKVYSNESDPNEEWPILKLYPKDLD
jgi:hypothetical protein